MNGLQLFEFEKEIYVWSKLKHPNVLPLLGYAFDADTGYPMLISQWMERGNALSYIRVNDIPIHRVMDLVRNRHLSPVTSSLNLAYTDS